MNYYIVIRFQGCEYRSIETYSTYTLAADEAVKRFGRGGAVQWDVFSEG